MKKIVTTFLLTLFFTSVVPAQNELNFEFDYARFNYDSSSVYLEFYYELNPKNMQIIATDKGSLTEAMVHIEMKNTETNSFFINKDWRIQNIINPAEHDSNSKSLAGMLGFVVPSGKYILQVLARDSKNPNLNKKINETLFITPFKKDIFSVSDIEIANNIKKENADPQSIFYKNTLEIIPNPEMLYTHNSPVLFYYAELYNLKLENEKKDFSLQKLLYNSAGVPVYKSTKNIKQSNDAVVEYGIVNLLKYPSDSYNFVLSLIDPTTNKAFISSKRFYIFNPNVVDTSKTFQLNTGVIGSEFGIFTLDECDKMFSEAKYIATKQEIYQYKTLDSLNAKREFLYNFWLKRDPTPGTTINEFKEDYLKRVAFANKNFSLLKKDGYLTDRGRVVLLYGEPDQRDFYPSDAGLKPYEVWFYNQIEGGVNFYFGDVTGFGNFELLHSTKRDEVKDENWMRRISSQ